VKRNKLRCVLFYGALPLASTGDAGVMDAAAAAALAESVRRAEMLSDPDLQAIERSEVTRMRELFRDLGLAHAGGRVM
jgi:hypothetical protein